ncbi:MAG: CHC2 zinc finger domain-containing protein, partial [Bacteroidota bacterium]
MLRYYGLKPDRNNRLRCPFHEDRTPSLQIYYKTHTCYCFSTACPTHGHSLDVIDFIMHMEKCSKHEAILKSKSLITGSAIEASTAQTISPSNPSKRITVLTQIFTYFKNGVHNSQPAKDYLKKRGLDYTKT